MSWRNQSASEVIQFAQPFPMNYGPPPIREMFEPLRPLLDEGQRRLWAATEARALGRGGIAFVARATGLVPGTVRRGVRELEAGLDATGPGPHGRVRRRGGGRKRLTARDPGLAVALERLLEPVTRGDPMVPLRWTCRSAAHLAAELKAEGRKISERTVNRMLHELGYSLQSNRKMLEGRQHADRDAQFRHLDRRVRAFQRMRQPVISVDCKKKELVGRYRNGGREWNPRGRPQEVNVHDFPDKERGKAIPYGVCDIGANAGWVSVGVDHDTAAFAVETLRRWWREVGQSTYCGARRLLVTADGGGSNSSRSRLWKLELQLLADELDLTISVCHLPPGTSKWNKIEHRLFCHITQNWRGRPLVSREVTVNLIGATTTKKGLTVQAALDKNEYPLGRKVTDSELASLKIKRDKFHGEWNYHLSPRA